jgi:hypothetical protein
MSITRLDRSRPRPRCDSCQHREATYTDPATGDLLCDSCLPDDPAAAGIHPRPLSGRR